MTKSGPKKYMEKALIEAVYWMGVESLDPDSFKNLEHIITRLHSNRNLGVWKIPPHNGEKL